MYRHQSYTHLHKDFRLSTHFSWQMSMYELACPLVNEIREWCHTWLSQMAHKYSYCYVYVRMHAPFCCHQLNQQEFGTPRHPLVLYMSLLYYIICTTVTMLIDQVWESLCCGIPYLVSYCFALNLLVYINACILFIYVHENFNVIVLYGKLLMNWSTLMHLANYKDNMCQLAAWAIYS